MAPRASEESHSPPLVTATLASASATPLALPQSQTLLAPSLDVPLLPAATRTRWLVFGALLTLYVVWGSTYLAMHMTLESFPALRMGGIRFLMAGGLLYGILRFRGAERPTWKQWGSAALSGALLLACGNGLIAIAQSRVSSGVTSVVAASMPLWAAAFGPLFGLRPSRREWMALLVGFVGVALLGMSELSSTPGYYALILLGAPASWALGSLLGQRLPMPKGAMGSACQMISAGFIMMLGSFARGEQTPGPMTNAALGAFIYLVLIGSLLGFSAYGYLLRTVRPSLATSYAYVNPVVALLLGAHFGGEKISVGAWAACGVVLSSVGLLATSKNKRLPK